MQDAMVLSKGGLASKVSLLLTLSLGTSALGSYLGRNIQSTGIEIMLFIALLAGLFGVFLAAKISPKVGAIALGLWTFFNGVSLGPVLHYYNAELGWETVFLSMVGTGAVMAAGGVIGALSGRDFSGMGKYLFVALLGLLVFGFVGLFVQMGHVANLIHAVIGMVVFSLYFIFDFFWMTKTEDSWEAAIVVTLNLYLDAVNFLLYLLKFLMEMKKRD